MGLKMVRSNPSGFCGEYKEHDLERGPCPSVQKCGVDGDCHTHYWLEDDGKSVHRYSDDKPPYRVPTMAEIAASPKDGGVVASTFAGCGGSSLGYEMAGLRVAWANEWDKHAAECHALNFPDCALDRRDVREIRGAEVLEACDLREGELDVLDGSPPCQGFSTAGKRRVTDPRNSLFWEFARLLREMRPRMFVAENVAGMAKGTAKGTFKAVLRELTDSGYRVECRILDAQWLGVPQRRRRLIFIGVREDLELTPAFPRPLPYRYSVADACPWIASVSTVKHIRPEQGRHRFSPAGRSPSSTIKAQASAGTDWTSSPLITEHQAPTCGGENERRKFTIPELLRICGFPDDFALAGSYSQRWAVLGNSVPPVMMFHVARALRKSIGDAPD